MCAMGDCRFAPWRADHFPAGLRYCGSVVNGLGKVGVGNFAAEIRSARAPTCAAPSSLAGARGEDDPVVPVVAVRVFDEADAQVDLLTVEVHFAQQVAPVRG